MSTTGSGDDQRELSTIEKAAARLADRAKRGQADHPDPGVILKNNLAPGDEVAGQSTEPSARPGGTSAGEANRAHAGDEYRNVSGAANTQPGLQSPPGPRVDGNNRFELDLERMQARGYLTPGANRSVLAQQIRRLKRPILLRMQRSRALGDYGPPPNLIMVTSSLPGEGKTFTSINLAVSMAAEVDHRVLLVDADASRGDVSRQLGLPECVGLSGLLDQGSDFADLEIRDTNIDRLSILPAGQPVERLDELYASSTMAGMLHSLALADPERIVIFDCAPLLLATEVAALAHRMGQILVVVEANRTLQHAVMRSLSMLAGLDNVSLVLNKAVDAGEASYGYGYGYGYGAFGQGETGRGVGGAR